MYLAQIWRYPVKSMAGERLANAELTALGVPGDRELVVIGPTGRIETARTHPALLAHHGTLVDPGVVHVDGYPWRSLEATEMVRTAAGTGASLEPALGPGRFDILPLSVVSDGAVAALGVDLRRLRPNLVIGGVRGLAERDWEGRFLAIGDAVIGLAQLRARCVMTTFDPDTQVQDRTVLARIRSDFSGTFALDAWVARAGRVSEGDTVTVLDEFAEAQPPLLGRLARRPFAAG
jgi:uncharacterized protein YcbX